MRARGSINMSKTFPSFKEASQYASSYSREHGCSVRLVRHGDLWEVVPEPSTHDESQDVQQEYRKPQVGNWQDRKRESDAAKELEKAADLKRWRANLIKKNSVSAGMHATPQDPERCTVCGQMTLNGYCRCSR